MAKVFYIAMVDADTTQAFFFNNKKKAQEKGMELYDGFGEFSFNLRGEEFEGDYVTTYIFSGIENVREGFLFYREDGRPHFEAMDEANARTVVEDGSFEDAMGGYFSGKLKGGYGEIYMSSAVEGTNELWTFEADELYERKTMKYLPTFESFIGSQKLNENTYLSDSGDGVMDGSPEAEAKWAPVLKAFGVRSMDDLVWLGEYFPEIVREEGKKVKGFTLDNYGDEDPHGEVDFNVFKWNGMLIGEHDDELQYRAALCKEKDVSKWMKILKDDEDIDLY